LPYFLGNNYYYFKVKKDFDMNITIITVGKLKEKYLKDAISEYSKKLGKCCRLDIVEVEDEKTPDNASEREELKIKEKEGQAILKYVKDNMYVFALAIEGKMLSTDDFIKLFGTLKQKSVKDYAFIIGGSLGLSDEVLRRADYKLSFSKMTFPHQLMRVILLEQLNKAAIKQV
jgi:23S rRNA (pseudouridine1915-N3)-methyltransferase